MNCLYQYGNSAGYIVQTVVPQYRRGEYFSKHKHILSR